ncbi:hypothetical protein [Taklimakanibacter lacteus]|uniref:hypothetical protein n=1 Tax=Taklimakanibacter lacteus TaxID=2268456 RepID=UPI000E6712B2
MSLAKWRKGLLLLVSMVCLGACTGRPLQSVSLDGEELPYFGIIYSLPRGYLPVSIKTDASNNVVITEPTQKILPDPNTKFSLTLRNSAFAHDDQTVTTTADGLLSTVNAINEDQSVEIVKKIIELVTNVAKVGVVRLAAPRQFSVTTVIDPFNPRGELHRLEEITGFKFAITDLSGAKLPRYDEEYERQVTASCDASVCFRILTPVMLTISGQSKESEVLARFVVLVPNPRLIGTYDVRRGPCIKKTNELAFTNGVLTKIRVDKPSEVLGCLSIPIDVAKAIVSIPAELFKVKLENIGRDTQLAQAQTQAINAQIALLNAQAAYLARQPAPPPAQN